MESSCEAFDEPYRGDFVQIVLLLLCKEIYTLFTLAVFTT